MTHWQPSPYYAQSRLQQSQPSPRKKLKANPISFLLIRYIGRWEPVTQLDEIVKAVIETNLMKMVYVD